VARDRKRAKQRQQQRRAQSGVAASARGQVERADLPGALEHAGDVDEFDAALVRGAGGVPAEAEAGAELEAQPTADRLPEEPELATVTAGGRGGAGGGNGSAATEAFGEEAAAPAPRERRQSLPRRAVAFLRASWAELQRVQWPNRPQVSQATAVVIGFVAIAGLYLGAADWVAQRIVNFIL
jgi:preprotein translocase SecE subunit